MQQRPTRPRDAEPVDAAALMGSEPAGSLHPPRRRERVTPGLESLAFYVASVALTTLGGWWSMTHLPLERPLWRFSARQPIWVTIWSHWDSGWYVLIADHGYAYRHGTQSSVAFFPAYPAAMRIVGGVTGVEVAAAGVALTLFAGAVATLAFVHWCGLRLTPSATWTALAMLLLYPFSFYLFGAVYADAMFLAATVAAFVFVEHDHPFLAGLAGALASATRPLGIVVVGGLVLRHWERRRTEAGQGIRWRDSWILLSGAGLVAYCGLLWLRFGEPLAWLSAQAAWDQRPGPRTWLKFRAFAVLMHSPVMVYKVAIIVQALFFIGALLLVPRVFRRFGRAYGTYTLAMILVVGVGSSDFVGVGRYLLAAFPCFAVLGELLADKRPTRAVALGCSAIGLAVGMSLYACSYYMS